MKFPTLPKVIDAAKTAKSVSFKGKRALSLKGMMAKNLASKFSKNKKG